MKKIATLIALLFTGAAQADVVDVFSGTVDYTVSDTTNDSTSTVLFSAGSSTSGADRDLAASSSNGGNVTGETITTLGSPDDLYLHTQAAGATGFSTLTYNFGNFDFTSGTWGGQNAFRLFVNRNAGTDGTLTVTVKDGANTATKDLAINAIVGGGSGGYADFIYTDFVSAFTFNSVDSLSFTVTGDTAGLQVALSDIEAVCSGFSSTTPSPGSKGAPPGGGSCAANPIPEPASLSLLGLGLLGLGALRLRRG